MITTVADLFRVIAPSILSNARQTFAFMWDRMTLVPFTEDIPAGEVIKADDLMRRLLDDREAVLAWAVQGARDHIELDGLGVPPVIQAEIDKYKFEQDSIAQFIAERARHANNFASFVPMAITTNSSFEPLTVTYTGLTKSSATLTANTASRTNASRKT